MYYFPKHWKETNGMRNRTKKHNQKPPTKKKSKKTKNNKEEREREILRGECTVG